MIAFPELLLAIIISAALGGGFWTIVFVLAAAFVPGFARVARAQTLAVKQEPYIEAAVACGVRTPDDHPAPHRAQHRRAHRGADDAVDGLGHPPRGVAELPRPRHAGRRIRAGATSSATA